MVEESTKLPGGLIIAGQKAPGDATDDPKLRLFPSADGVQHCEVVGMAGTVESKVPKWLQLGDPVRAVADEIYGFQLASETTITKGAGRRRRD
jgi:hypothetical protein